MVFFGLMGISSKKGKKFKISKEVRTTANDAATPADDAESIFQAYIKYKLINDETHTPDSAI